MKRDEEDFFYSPTAEQGLMSLTDAYGKLRPWTAIERYECASVDSLFLVDLMTDNPIHCGVCRKEVDPERLRLSVERDDQTRPSDDRSARLSRVAGLVRRDSWSRGRIRGPGTRGRLARRRGLHALSGAGRFRSGHSVLRTLLPGRRRRSKASTPRCGANTVHSSATKAILGIRRGADRSGRLPTSPLGRAHDARDGRLIKLLRAVRRLRIISPAPAERDITDHPALFSAVSAHIQQRCIQKGRGFSIRYLRLDIGHCPGI